MQDRRSRHTGLRPLILLLPSVAESSLGEKLAVCLNKAEDKAQDSNANLLGCEFLGLSEYKGEVN